MVRHILIQLLILVLPIQIFAQTLNERVKNLESFTENYAEEKVYLHLERTAYYPSETIWFKAYLVAGALLEPSPLSKILYVDLVDGRGDVQLSQKYVIENSQAHGSIQVPLGAEKGKYVVRAYTRYQLTQDPEIIFEKPIQIVHSKELVSTYERQEDDLLIDFFPEGGTLVAGVENVIAFKATDSNGNEREAEGVIVDGQGAEVLRFATSHNGMGKFSLMTESDKNYYALIGEKKLPLADQYSEVGLSLVRENADQVRVTLKNRIIDNSLALIVHSRGYTSYVSKIKMNSKTSDIYLDAKYFKPGISVVTITDSEFNPIAERLYFNSDNAFANVQMDLRRLDTQVKSKVEVEISATNPDGSPAQGTFSLFAYDNSQVEVSNASDDISSYFLMSSELKGKISTPKALMGDEEALDLVMLTNGWRRYSWSDKSSSFHEPQDEIADVFHLKGVLKREFSKKGFKNNYVSLLNFSSNDPLVAQGVTNDQGYFELNEIHYSASDSIYLRAERIRKGYKFVLDDNSLVTSTPPKDVLSYYSNDEVVESRAIKSSLYVPFYEGGKFRRLDDIQVTAKKVRRNPTIERFGRGTYSKTFDSNSIHGRNPITLLASIPGVHMTLRNGNPSLSLRGFTPQVYVDGFPSGVGLITLMDPTHLESVEVYVGPEASRFIKSQAVIGFTTKMPDVNYEESRRALSVSEFGFNKPVEFYSPSYDMPSSNEQDLRAILHWEPMIETDENGKATVTFWNSSLPSEVVIDLQGFIKNGLTGSTSLSYQVKSKSSL